MPDRPIQRTALVAVLALTAALSPVPCAAQFGPASAAAASGGAGPLAAASAVRDAARAVRAVRGSERPACQAWSPSELRENPSAAELRCRWAVSGPGRFGLLSYADFPVYQPATPMPGTHLVGLPGHTGPRPGESYEGWEWRVHRTSYDPSYRTPGRSLETLDPQVAARILGFEAALAEAGVRAERRETWRHPDRQAYIFQQGRSRPGPLATTTLTSWHSQVDAAGNPAGRAVDYDVRWADMVRFHEIARASGLHTFGADSHDPGHVFVPDPRPVDPMELALLRVLPRVPEVTLATGIPVDRSLPVGGRSALRAAAREFAAAAFVPALEPRVSGWLLTAEIVGASDDAHRAEAGENLPAVMLQVDGR